MLVVLVEGHPLADPLNTYPPTLLLNGLQLILSLFIAMLALITLIILTPIIGISIVVPPLTTNFIASHHNVGS